LDRRDAAVAWRRVRRDLGASLVTILITVVVCVLIAVAAFVWFFVGPYLNNRK
jgi:hypothetical protein